MPKATTKLCTVYRAITLKIEDSAGRPSVRVSFAAGNEYNLTPRWYAALREQGALTPPGKSAPPPWPTDEQGE